MGKLKLASSDRHTISSKVISELKKSMTQKIVDFTEIKDAKIHAENLSKSVISHEKMADYDPIHAIYIYAQNTISVLIEQLCELKPLMTLNNAYADAEESYMPSGPPASPLTKSYFTCWGFFDLCTGMQRESLGTVAIDVSRALSMDQGLIKIFEDMEKSRMGFYIHEGVSGKFVYLREIITQQRIKAFSASGYVGKAGEIWYTRVMPEPFPDLQFGYSVIFTSPYIMTEIIDGRVILAREENWLSFFDRNLAQTGIKDNRRAYEHMMKYGLNKNYWNEFIMDAYVNHQSDMIYLAGYHDIPLSKPHSRESQKKMGY